MKLPEYDVLIPTLFVALIFPAAAGGWLRYFSGYQDQMAIRAVDVQVALPGTAEKVSERGNAVLAAHRVGHQGASDGRRLKSAKPARDTAGSYISPDKSQACRITQPPSGFGGFYLSAEAGE